MNTYTFQLPITIWDDSEQARDMVIRPHRDTYINIQVPAEDMEDAVLQLQFSLQQFVDERLPAANMKRHT